MRAVRDAQEWGRDVSAEPWPCPACGWSPLEADEAQELHDIIESTTVDFALAQTRIATLERERAEMVGLIRDGLGLGSLVWDEAALRILARYDAEAKG